MKILHQLQEIIANRYQIITILGQGGMGITYAAIDLTNSQQVAIKVVSLIQANEWKVLELFKREAKVLADLNHPYIPNYIDYFELDTDSDKRFYLVQELVEGKSLSDLVEQGWHSTEEEVKNIARQILEILVYLHSSTPPVIHRDIKPQNIIRQPDGRVYLVDFGSVQAAYRNTISIGGTFVGTLGYMSPEQLRGKIVPAADLYSLGCSLLFLLTHRSPHELPQRGMGIDFSSIVNISSIFTEWLARIIEPIVEDRFQSAQDALQALSNKSININNPILLPANLSNQTSKYLQKKRYEIGREHESLGTHLKPKLSNLVIHKKDDRVLIKILLKRRGIIINLSTAIIVNLKKYIVKTSRNIEYIEFYDIHSDYGDLLIIVNAFILLINIFIPILVFISKPLLIVLLIIVLANGVLNFSLSMINEINTIFGQYESILNISSCILLILVIVVIDLLWIIFNYLYCYYYLEINNKKINMVQKCLFFTI